MSLKTLSKRISTSENGIFYKEIVNENGKVVDKIFLIRYREDEKDKLVTVGKYSAGIRIAFCKQKRNEILNSIRLGENITIKHKKQQKGILFDKVANMYFEDIKIYSTKNTLIEVKNRYKNHLLPFFQNREIENIKSKDLEKVQKEKIKILSPKSVNQIIELFGTIFNYGIKKDFYKTINPTIKIKKFKIDNTRERYLSLEEIKELYFYLEDNNLLTLFVKLALTTGGRLETILSIQKKDINLATNTITLKDLKNNDTYKGFLSDEICEILESMIDNLKANDYIVSIDKSKMTSRQIQSRLKPILDRLFNAELDTKDRKNRVVIHTLRHTFASHLAINGTPIFTIQKLMNHKDIKQTMRYAKLAPDSGKDFVNGLYK